MYLVSRTVNFAETEPWGDGFHLEDEVGYVNTRYRATPKWLMRWADLWFPIQFALRLLRTSHRFEGFCVGRYAYWFPVLYRLLRGSKPIVLTDTEWKHKARNRPGILNRLAVQRADLVCCNTLEEIRRYSSTHDLPIHKFRHVRMAFQHRDLHPTADQGYIFAGGNQSRDWNCLFAAVEGLPFPVRLFTTVPLRGVPSNVEVASVSRAEYYRQMANASCVVIPLTPEPLRITGTTSFINAMAMAKAVVVTEPFGAPDYMRNGVEGFYCDYGDAAAVRCCVELLMADERLRERVGAAAQRRARSQFSPDVHRREIAKIMNEASRMRNKDTSHRDEW